MWLILEVWIIAGFLAVTGLGVWIFAGPDDWSPPDPAEVERVIGGRRR